MYFNLSAMQIVVLHSSLGLAFQHNILMLYCYNKTEQWNSAQHIRQYIMDSTQQAVGTIKDDNVSLNGIHMTLGSFEYPIKV